MTKECAVGFALSVGRRRDDSHARARTPRRHGHQAQPRGARRQTAPPRRASGRAFLFKKSINSLLSVSPQTSLRARAGGRGETAAARVSLSLSPLTRVCVSSSAPGARGRRVPGRVDFAHRAHVLAGQVLVSLGLCLVPVSPRKARAPPRLQTRRARRRATHRRRHARAPRISSGVGPHSFCVEDFDNKAPPRSALSNSPVQSS